MEQIKLLDTKDIYALRDYAMDHLEHFDGLPCDFETESGEVWDYDLCWEVYEFLGLVDLLPENRK
jgi:hypothetical protein